ncbi:ABC transporter substrate-binding protein [Bradyrhizobium sp.]|jgi:branched-chain amino acid transport system substrate-binding protein|uniref:ABC transporter substrate-binding protein n=1 Tax=Bradyrhizobium sp. TaxID=376 RepID=UPI003C1624C8
MFGKGLRGALWAAVVLGGFFGVSFGAFSTQARADEPGMTPDSITIGAFGPITGPAAYIGLAGRDGANLAIKEINAAGGINGRKLSMIFEDDGHSPTKALAAVKKLIDQDHVFMIFCVAGSNGTLGAIDFVRENGRVMYVSFASAPGVTWPFARNLFRGGTTEVPRYGELYAEYLHDYLKATKIAILNGREEYPKNEGDALTAQLKNWYQTAPVKRAEFNIGDKDFTPQLLDIQGADPQVIAIFGNPAEAAIAMRQAKELGINASFFLGTTMVDQSLLNVAKQAAEGASGFALLPLLPSSSNPEMKSWVAKWKQEYPNLPAGRPNVFDVLSYSDMYAVSDALKRAGKDLTTDRLIDTLEATHDYRAGAIASPLTFTKKHHIGNLRLQAMQVKNGEWEPVAFEGKRESDILKRYQ